jgi:hypothetical protein
VKTFLASLFHVDKPATRVIVFGAVGGALGVLASGVAGELTGRWWLLASPALGAGAAFIAVFVLLGIKTEDVLRCCGVALLAGFFWQPVFAAGKDYLANATQREKEAQVAETADELEAVSKQIKASPTNSDALVEKAAALTEDLTRDTADLRPSATKMRAQSAINTAVGQLRQQAVDKGQPAAQAAVTSVAETALNHGNMAVADKARRELARVPVTSNTNLEARKREIMTMRPLLRVSPSK